MNASDSLASLLAAIPYPLAVLDLRGVPQAVNEHFSKATGWTAAELPDSGQFPFTAKILDEFQNGRLKEFLASREPHLQLQVKLRTADGGENNAIFRYNKFYKDSLPQGVVLSVSIPDALENTKVLFDILTETVEDIFWIADVETSKTVYVSKSYEKIWGRSVSSVFADPASFLDAIIPEDLERVKSAVSSKRAGEKWSVEYRITRPDGTVRWIHDRAFPVSHGLNGMNLYVGITRDITGLKNLSNELARERLDKHLGRLTAILAHDFNNILGIALLNASRLRMAKLDEGERQALEKTISAIQRGSDLSRTVVTIIKGTELPANKVVLDTFIKDFEALLVPPQGSRAVLSFRLRAPKIAVQVSRSGLLNAVLNLLINACQSVDKNGGGYVKITTGIIQIGDQPEYASISVQDDGEGFPLSLEGLYSSALLPAHGVGLLSVQEFCKRNGGKLKIESRPHSGAAVSILLPVFSASATGIPGTTSGLISPRLRVLVVDDELEIAEAVGKILRDNDYYCDVCGGAAEAIEAANSAKYNLLISDVVMPNMDGISLAERFCKIQPQAKVLLMTGYIPDFRNRNVAHAIIEKPLEAEQLLQFVRDLTFG